MAQGIEEESPEDLAQPTLIEFCGQAMAASHIPLEDPTWAQAGLTHSLFLPEPHVS